MSAPHPRPLPLLPLLPLLLLLLPPAAAHSFLTDPRPYTTRYHTRHCRGAECTNACPLSYNVGMANSIDRPEKVWARGARVTVAWAKNNHHGGFVRLALVPAAVMNDRTWHDRLTLLHACWHSGLTACRGRAACGTDRDRLAFSREVEIPTAFPDGDYVLGLVWYGGVRKHRGFFPDFFSCSHVRIAGGPLGGAHAAFFDPGDGPADFVRPDACYTSSDAIGECGNRGCLGARAFWGRPKSFRSADRVGRITPELVERAMEEGEEHATDGRAAEGVIDGEETVKGGVCSGRFCCLKSCGKCGGPGCAFRRGGKEGCCMAQLKRARRICGPSVSPPCLIN